MRRALRAGARAIGSVAGIAVVFIAALAAGVLLHLNVPAARRLAAHQVNELLAPLFEGRLTVQRIGALHMTGIRGADVRIDAADGRPVILAYGVRANVRPAGIVRSVLFGKGDLVIDVFDIRVDGADVRLDSGEATAPEIADAFVLRPVASTPATSSSPGRGLRLSLDGIQIGHAWAHGKMRGVPALDADVDELRAAMLITRDEVTIDASRLELTARGMPDGANPVGHATTRLAIPLGPSREPLRMAVSFVGEVGGVPLSGSGSSEGSNLLAVVDVPEVEPGKVSKILSNAPVAAPITARVTAQGPLAKVAITAHAGLGQAEIDATGDLSVTGAFSASGQLDVRHLDARSVSASAPASTFDAHARGSVAAGPDGRLSGQLDLDVHDAAMGKEPLPSAMLHASGGQTSGSASEPPGWFIDVTGNVDEPGAPTHITAHLHPQGTSAIADFDVKTDVAHLEALERVPGLGAGSVVSVANGSVILARPFPIDVALDARLDGLRRGPLSIGRARVCAHARGAAMDPALDGTLEAADVRIEGRAFSRATAQATGTVGRQVVNLSLQGGSGPSVDASATIGFGATTTMVRDGRVTLSRAGTSMTTRVRSARLASDAVRVEGVDVTGPGIQASADLTLGSGVLFVRADSTGVDLANVGRLLGARENAMGGLLTFSVDVKARDRGAEGTAIVDLQRGRFARVGEASGHLEAKMNGRSTDGSLHASAGDLGTLDVEKSHVEIGGRGPLSLDSWRNAWGSVGFRAKVDLARLNALLPAGTLPVSELSGQLVAEGHAERRGESDYAPTMALSVKTVGLVLDHRVSPDEVHDGITTVATTPWQSSSVDVQLDARIDGSTSGELATRLVDRDGAVALVDVKSNAIPYELLLHPRAGLVEELKRVPFAALVFVPSRSLRRFPALFRLPVADGGVTGSVLVLGTALTPRIVASLKLSAATLPGLTRHMDADLEGRYDGGAADVTVTVGSHQKEIFQASAHADASMHDLLAGDVDGEWTGSLNARLDAFPLAAIEALSGRQVKGLASGALEITGLHKDAHLHADVRVAGFQVGTAAYTGAHGVVALDGHALDAQATLDETGGFARASAKIATRWGASLLPSRDETGAVTASFQAKALRIAVLTPFLKNTADELDGVVDANATLSLHAEEKPVMQGSVVLHDGRIELSALGEEFHGMQGKLVLSPDGVVQIEDITALGSSGKVTASGSARLDGVDLVAAHVVASIAKKDALPLHVQGSNIGTVYGQFDVKDAISADRGMAGLDVSMPSLHVELPDSSSHLVQGLEPAPGSHVGVFRTPDRFALLALGPPPETGGSSSARSRLTVAVHLGSDVEVRRGTDVRVGLTGNASVSVADKTTVRGQIRLERGRLTVQGKKFEIENGTVTFVGDDPGNPQVNVTAGWTAPDGTRIHADFVGPLKTGKVKLRSEPARSQDEIASLIMFGSADGSATTPYANTSADAGTTLGTSVGGFATEGLSRGLDRLTGLDFTTKIDTSTANARPEVEVQIARDISLQIAVVLGTPPPGTNLDTTYATLAWRFFRNWSLATTFGDKGSSIADIVWRHRY